MKYLKRAIYTIKIFKFKRCSEGIYDYQKGEKIRINWMFAGKF